MMKCTNTSKGIMNLESGQLKVGESAEVTYKEARTFIPMGRLTLAAGAAGAAAPPPPPAKKAAKKATPRAPRKQVARNG